MLMLERTRNAAFVLAALLFVTPAMAATFSLDDLVNGTVPSFTSDNGLLTFGNFDVKRLKKLSGNLSLYTVTTVADGFELRSSAFVANSGGLKKLDITYTVSANRGLITGASMAMEATRTSGRVKVEKDIDDPNSDQGTFLLTLLRSNRDLLDDSDTFEPGAALFEVEEAIRIKKISTLTSVRNSYTVTVVPEPMALSLLTTGLGGLAWIGRRRAVLSN
jgi:hypothetical protein